MQASCLKGDILKRTLAVSLYAGTSPLLSLDCAFPKEHTVGFLLHLQHYSPVSYVNYLQYSPYFSSKVTASIPTGKVSLSGCLV